MRALCQDWESWLFYLMCRNLQREFKKTKKQKNVFQTKEQGETPETG